MFDFKRHLSVVRQYRGFTRNYREYGKQTRNEDLATYPGRLTSGVAAPQE